MVYSALLVKNMSIAERLATNEEWTFFFSDTEKTNHHEDDQNKPDWLSQRIWNAIKM